MNPLRVGVGVKSPSLSLFQRRSAFRRMSGASDAPPADLPRAAPRRSVPVGEQRGAAVAPTAEPPLPAACVPAGPASRAGRDLAGRAGWAAHMATQEAAERGGQEEKERAWRPSPDLPAAPAADPAADPAANRCCDCRRERERERERERDDRAAIERSSGVGRARSRRWARSYPGWQAGPRLLRFAAAIGDCAEHPPTPNFGFIV